MPQTPDREPGESYEEGTVYDNRIAGDVPVEAGGIRYVNGAFSMLDALGLFNPRASTSAGDEALLEIAPNSVGMTYAIAWSGDVVTRESWTQTANGRERKRIDYTYSGWNVQTELIKVFSLTDGVTVTAQKTITYTYQNDWRVASSVATRDV